MKIAVDLQDFCSLHSCTLSTAPTLLPDSLSFVNSPYRCNCRMCYRDRYDHYSKAPRSASNITIGHITGQRDRLDEFSQQALDVGIVRGFVFQGRIHFGCCLGKLQEHNVYVLAPLNDWLSGLPVHLPHNRAFHESNIPTSRVPYERQMPSSQPPLLLLYIAFDCSASARSGSRDQSATSTISSPCLKKRKASWRSARRSLAIAHDACQYYLRAMAPSNDTGVSQPTRRGTLEVTGDSLPQRCEIVLRLLPAYLKEFFNKTLYCVGNR